MSGKDRIDNLLVQKALAETRTYAKSIIMSGKVYVNGQKTEKAGMMVPVDSDIEVRAPKLKYVSRGGLKLEKAVDCFKLRLKGLTCMDIGASTGGFTDVMLQNGANKVFAVDVGYGQFDWRLRNDPRVKLLEKTNARYLKFEQIGEMCHFASVDVSFISLQKIIAPIAQLLVDNGEMVCLIKPQFEAGRNKVGKKGVVRDTAVHREVIGNTCAYAKEAGMFPVGLTYSPIKGPNGNIEYLIHLSKTESGFSLTDAVVQAMDGILELQ